MLSALVAHAGLPLQPHDLWGAWNGDPLVVIGLLAAGGGYARGVAASRRRPSRRRSRLFTVGLLALAAALLSPLDAASGVLASAHMVQHVLLLAVAAPALALSRPTATILAGFPARLRHRATRVRVGAGLRTSRVRWVWRPVVAWLAYVGALWLWHAAVLYDAALRHDVVHVLEHASFLAAGLAFWGLVVGAHGAHRIDRGQAMLLVFTAAVPTVLLSALLTFAGSPWYEGFLTTTHLWGLDPLTDQQLAGVIMWVPSTAIHVAAVLALLGAWMRETDAATPHRLTTNHLRVTSAPRDDGSTRPRDQA